MKHKIKGDIIGWNSSIYDFNYKMRSIKEDEDIELEINSYGGDVFLGIDLCNTLRSHKGEVTVTITGIAASAASIICMGADKIKAYSNAQMMIHNAWTVVAGNAKELRKVADDLDSIGESVLASYTHRAEADDVKKMLEEETYLSASKALEKGLIDEIIDIQPESVESKIFENKAKEFNNKVVAVHNQEPVVAVATKEMEETISMLKNEIEQLKNQSLKEPDQEPAEPKKQNLSTLFLNL
ncbi:head maturation protease, ClpP-related [Alkalihalophilus marmarensis]|uniref:head maturation protease, ClpP-related n=1 Tax=Alkalihalophilus marmarensis TaxID=521377 RepID=UPI002E1AB4DA|nr:head maturation protease, ClpP-related [Alkalihalophilus marmarensis]MED1603644.1 Clp protease ClpP [Alkalihalophilus marmarensis]